MLVVLVLAAACQLPTRDPAQAARRIFDFTDADRNGLVDFAEASRLQLATNPALPLSWSDWEALLRATGSDRRMDYPAFASTYLHAPLARAIGADAVRDEAVLHQRCRRTRVAARVAASDIAANRPL